MDMRIALQDDACMTDRERLAARAARRVVLDRTNYGGAPEDEYLPFSFTAAQRSFGVGGEDQLIRTLRALGATPRAELPAGGRRAEVPAAWWMRRRRLSDLASLEPDTAGERLEVGLHDQRCWCGSDRLLVDCHGAPTQAP